MRKIILIFLLMTWEFCSGQKQGNIWYFGDHAGLDFNSGVPVSISDGQTYLQYGHAEGTAVICDSAGSLLFYSNGEKIWNRNHQIMMNGDSILSNFSSTQSSLIIPLPGSQHLFYLFTVDDFNYHHLQYGFRYSVIDMCMDSSLGAVVSAQKNILILDTVSEKLTAVRHHNGIDYWIIVHKYYSDAFYAYRFTSNGVNDTVITHIGSAHRENCIPPSPDSTRAAIGNMKASPNGKKIALVCTNTCRNLRELFDFNDSTGVVSNFVDLVDLQLNTAYGVSFSPDNSKLYIADNAPGNIFQYDVTAGGGNQDSIKNSKIQVVTNLYAILGIQLGPDGKIYVTRLPKHFIAAINNPNQQGLACNFQDSVVYLGSGICSYGLQNMIDSYSYSNTVINCSTGINEVEENNFISIYPNPTTSSFTLNISSEGEIFLQIINPLGEVVYAVNLFGKNEYVVDANFTKGIYFVRVRVGAKNVVRKLIIE